MDNLTCEYCQKSFETKYKYQRHLNKKYSCKYYSPLIKIGEEDDSEVYECRNCGKSYKTRNALSCHLHRCSELKKLIKIEKMEINDNSVTTDNSVTNIDNSITNIDNSVDNSINNNIQINIDREAIKELLPFGKDNMDCLTQAQITQAIGNGGLKTLTQLLNNVHFDKNHPENHNFIIDGSHLAITFDGHGWEENNADIIVDLIVSRLVAAIEAQLGKLDSNFPGHYGATRIVRQYHDGEGSYINDSVKKTSANKSYVGKSAKKAWLEKEKAEFEALHRKQQRLE